MATEALGRAAIQISVRSAISKIGCSNLSKCWTPLSTVAGLGNYFPPTVTLSWVAASHLWKPSTDRPQANPRSQSSAGLPEKCAAAV